MSSWPHGGLATLALLAAVGLAACGGTVVYESNGDGTSDDGDGDGDSDGGSDGTVTSTGSGSPTTCSTTDDCAADEVCAFDDGVCLVRCTPDSCDACGPGTQCVPCATSSCPGCKDCVSACLPTNGCDDDDDCGVGFACYFETLTCTPTCSPDGVCDDGAACSFCATGSCCGCRDCVDLCLP